MVTVPLSLVAEHETLYLPTLGTVTVMLLVSPSIIGSRLGTAMLLSSTTVQEIVSTGEAEQVKTASSPSSTMSGSGAVTAGRGTVCV